MKVTLEAYRPGTIGQEHCDNLTVVREEPETPEMLNLYQSLQGLKSKQ